MTLDVQPAPTTPAAPPAPIDYAAPAKPSHRVAMFDAMRVVAAFAVIFTHTANAGRWKPVANALQFGVAFFTIAALILLARSIARRPDQSFRAYTATRVKRILGPLAIWTGIYLLFFWAMNRLVDESTWTFYGWGDRSPVEIFRSLLLGGAAIHLWFLPFILLACVGAFPVLKLARTRPATRYWIVPTFAAAGLLAVVGIHAFLMDPVRGGLRPDTFVAGYDRGARLFLEYAIWSLPTLFWAVAIAMVYPTTLSDRAALVVALLGIALFAAAAAAVWLGANSPAIRAVKGVAVAMVALAHWSPRFVQVLARFGTLSFGVYLVHLAFVVLFREAGTRVASQTVIWFYPAVAVAAFVASYGVVVLFNRYRLGRALFP